jgi:hypothetical protein
MRVPAFTGSRLSVTRSVDRELLDALREAGSDRGCWTWWSSSESPQTTGRIPTDSLRLDGDRHVLDQLIAWEPEE